MGKYKVIIFKSKNSCGVPVYELLLKDRRGFSVKHLGFYTNKKHVNSITDSYK